MLKKRRSAAKLNVLMGLAAPAGVAQGRRRRGALEQRDSWERDVKSSVFKVLGVPNRSRKVIGMGQ